MQIYDRWGELVYYTNDLYEGWNGRKNNDSENFVPMGTYNYIIKFNDYSGIKHEYTGGINLIK